MKIGKFVKDGEFIHDKNFAPKQNERDCPMTIMLWGKAKYSLKR